MRNARSHGRRLGIGQRLLGLILVLHISRVEEVLVLVLDVDALIDHPFVDGLMN